MLRHRHRKEVTWQDRRERERRGKVEASHAKSPKDREPGRRQGGGGCMVCPPTAPNLVCYGEEGKAGRICPHSHPDPVQLSHSHCLFNFLKREYVCLFLPCFACFSLFLKEHMLAISSMCVGRILRHNAGKCAKRKEGN